jgi:hypothetical protein
MELLTKSAAGLTFIGAMYSFEKDNLEEGLGMFQERSSDGTIRNRTYDFPYSFYKAIGRLAAYAVRDGEIPRAAMEEVGAVFGPQQLTRQLGDSVKASYDLLYDLATAEDIETKKALADVVQKSAAMYVSGYTRPIDPVNTVVSLMKGEDYVSPDRKQGHEWLNNSLRYTDEILDAMDIYTKPEGKERPLAVSKDRVPIGRIFGFREELAQTPAQQMFNEAGLAQWRTGIRVSIPETANEVSRLITPLINMKAADLLETSAWSQGTGAKRREYISNLISQAKADIRDILESSLNPEDTKASLLLKLGEGNFISRKELDKMLRDLGLGDNPVDLDLQQLQLLVGIIETEKDIEKDTKKILGLK